MALSGVAESVVGQQAGATLKRVDDMLTRSLRLTRSLVQEISVSALKERDLPFAVKWTAQQMEEKFGLHVALRCDGTLPPIDADTYVCLYRVIQEVLFNVVKHAGVKRVEVELASPHQESVRIVIRDEGCGLSRAASAELGKENGFGLFSIRERIEGLGGRIDVSCTPGKGTAVCLIVPVRSGH